jgi:nucleotide-binding universal stress UspA family protein
VTNTGPALLAYDGSPSSATAIAVAGRLLRGRRAVLCHAWSGVSQTLFHAQPAALPGVLSEAAADLDELDGDTARTIAAEGVELANTAGFDAEPWTERRDKKTWRAILRAVGQSGASVLVCGAQGRSGIGRAVLGSVSAALVHHARVPVLVVPSTAADEATSGPPLLCYDGSDGAKEAIAGAREVLDAPGALVFHCWESWVAEAPALARSSGMVQGMAGELDEIATEQSRGRTREGVDAAERAGFEAEGVSERAAGPIWMTVLEAAERHESSVVVVGSRGLTGISAALGSVSNGVVHHSRRPVLVVPPEDEPAG